MKFAQHSSLVSLFIKFAPLCYFTIIDTSKYKVEEAIANYIIDEETTFIIHNTDCHNCKEKIFGHRFVCDQMAFLV